MIKIKDFSKLASQFLGLNAMGIVSIVPSTQIFSVNKTNETRIFSPLLNFIHDVVFWPIKAKRICVCNYCKNINQM